MASPAPVHPVRPLIVVAVCLLTVLAAVPPMVPAADGETIAVTQGDTCFELTTLGDGTTTVSDFYDYRSGSGTEYASYGTTDIQLSQVSQLFGYRGSDGLSLVILHDKLGDGTEGGVVTFDISGLPADGEWAVEDDQYDGRDDEFEHSGSTSHIDWFWAPNRTDGAAFRGLDLAGSEGITIEPGFNENADHWNSSWKWSTNRTDSWIARSATGETVTLDMNTSVTVRAGHCPSEPPTAAIDAPATSELGEAVTLDASGSTDDVGIVEYRWDFDGDGDSDNATDDATIETTYDTTGAYNATVTVVDANGQTDTANTTIDVVDTTPPTPVIDAPSTATTGEAASFSAVNSTDNGDIASYEWAFGDGETASGEEVTHTYDTVGSYEVTLTVTDAAGNNATNTATVEVTEPDTTAPTAALTVPDPIPVGESVTLDASDSTDDTGIAEYRWDLDGDGDIDTTGDATVETTYDDLGSVTVEVTVVDAAGNTNTTAQTVNVTDEEPPTAAIDAPATAQRGEETAFSATASTDNHDIVSYEWVFGDGDSASGETVTHTYDTVGSYEVTLTVTDAAGNNATDTATVEVGDTDTTAPTAALSVPGTVELGTTTTLDASDATDDTGIAEYRWDLDGDGSIDRTTTTNTTDYTFPATGDYTPSVTVADAAGNEATASAETTVEDTTPPSIDVNAPGSVTVGDTVTLSASGSTDNGEIDSYEWTLWDGATASGESVTRTVDDEGTLSFSVTVTDTAGNADTATHGITATAAQSGSSGGSSSGGSSSGGTSSGGSSSSASSGGSSVSPPPEPEPELAATATTDSTVSVTGLRLPAGERVGVDLPALGNGSTQVERLTFAATDDTDELTFTLRSATGDGAPVDVVLTGIDVSGDHPALEQARYEFTLPESVSSSGEVVVYTVHEGTWVKSETRLMGVSDGRLRYSATVPQLGPTVVGLQQSNVSVAAMTLSAEQVVVGDTLTVDAQLVNTGRLEASETVPFAVDGRVVEERTVRVAATGDQALTFSYQFPANGTHTVAVGDRVATVEVLPRTPSMSVTELSVAGDQFRPGEPITILATVTNDGAAPGRYDASLELFGEVVDVETVAVPPGVSREVRFSRTVAAPGTYTAVVGNQSVEFTVVSPSGESQTPTPTPTSDDGPGLGMLVGLTALLLAGWALRRR